MNKRAIVIVAVTILVASLFASFVFNESLPSHQAQTNMQNIVIRPDGSIIPSEAPIKQNGNFYSFGSDIYGTIKIQKSNIVLDGAGYTLSGPYNGSQTNVWVVGNGPNQSPDLVTEYIIGVDLGAKTIEGVTIQNLNIKNFSIGMYMWTRNNMVNNCMIYDNILGVMLSGSNTTVTNNYLAYNKQGVFFGFNGQNASIPSDVHINYNAFVSNEVQINGCLCKDYPKNETRHSWDNGKEGNYWSDYNGIDADNNGIGDSPYIVDIQNQDRYPLITNPFNFPNYPTHSANQLLIKTLIFTLGLITIIIVAYCTLRLINKYI